MFVNDILCVSAEPIALVDYLAVEQPDPERAEEIARRSCNRSKKNQNFNTGGNCITSGNNKRL